MGTKLICFDCDSTLSAIEGIDELARARGREVFARVESMTNDAMNGLLPVEAVFGRRLEIIQPRQSDADAVGRRYVETMEPTALATLAAVAEKGWTPIIISAGFRPIIAPLAKVLGIARIEAVDLNFDAAGNYQSYDETYPTTRSGGKPIVVKRLREEFAAEKVIMVGDGVSDLETKPVVDRFVGFGRYAARPRVMKEAHSFVMSLDEVIAFL